MRKIKIITSQDHLLIFIECTEENDEITCINKTTNLRSFPPPFAAFGLTGTFRQFRKDNAGEWQTTRTSTAPRILFRDDDVEAGHVSVSNTVVVGVLPKKSEILTNWNNTLGEASVNTTLNTTRESHDVIAQGNLTRKMNANTFVELSPDSIDDEIIIG